MSVYGDIRAALESQVANISGVPSAANRAWQNVYFEPTTGTTWIRMSFQPSRRRPQDVTADGLQRFDGLFLIDVFAPEGNGPASAETLADATVDAFEAGTVLSANGQTLIIEYAEIDRAPNQDSPWFQIPVTIKWKAFN
jgi:hypothetical protein